MDSCLLPRQLRRCPSRKARLLCPKLPAGVLPSPAPLCAAPCSLLEPQTSSLGCSAESFWAFSASFIGPQFDHCSFQKFKLLVDNRVPLVKLLKELCTKLCEGEFMEKAKLQGRASPGRFSGEFHFWRKW